MAKITIAEFAGDIGVSVEHLKQRLAEVGIGDKSADYTITDEEKLELLAFLRNKRGKKDSSDPEKIILKRKTLSEIKIPIAAQSRMKPRSKTVNVEYRRQRTYARRGVVAKDILQRQAAEQQAAEQQAAEQQAAEQQAAEQQAAEQQESEIQPGEIAGIEPTGLKAPENMADSQEVAPITEPQADPDETEINAASVDPAPEELAQQDEPVSADPPPPDAPKTKREQPKSNPNPGRKELHIASEKSGRRRKKPLRSNVSAQLSRKHGFERPTVPIIHEVEIPGSITVSELAQRMSVKGSDVIKTLVGLGSVATINQVIEQDVAAIVVEEMGHKPKNLKENMLEEEIIRSSKKTGKQISRAPIVTVMGHVDHGKTSLLDSIRNSKVVADEAGGITQHIGAYRVSTDAGDITFLDTPGHEAFTAMRARGTKVTDVVVIVVAADDGVMPQTEEAIQHARAGSVPIIIAVNKIDKGDADIERVTQQLSRHDLIPEDRSGDTMFINVSAKTGQGIDELLDGIILQAEILELQAVESGPASGVVIESRLDKGRGVVASILVQSGRLSKGDVILSGHEFGRVRVMIDHNGKEVSEAGASFPVEVLGLSGTPNAGDEMIVVPDEKKAREIALLRQDKSREMKMARQHAVKLDNLLSRMGAEEAASLNLMIKADVQGSAEAITDSLTPLGNEEIKVNIISSGVGGITESDINLAMASGGVVIGFNVRADPAAKKLADAEGVDLRHYSIIYDLVDDVKKAMNGMLEPEVREEVIGTAEVRDIFHSPRFGDIAGCMVVGGVISRNCPIRVLRGEEVIYKGELESLKRFKDDVSEVKSGAECGIGVKNYTDIKVGDKIETLELVEIERSI